MIGGAQDNWTSITFDLSSMNPWITVSDGDGMECFFDYDYPDSIVYSSQQYGLLRKSTNGGNSFFTILNIDGFFITPFFMHPTAHETLYAADNRIHQTTNGLPPWTIISDPPVVVNNLVVSMAQSKVNPDNMILVGEGSPSPFPVNPEVKVSMDGGVTWNDVSANIPGEALWIIRVVTHPTDPNTMYIVRTGLYENNKFYDFAKLHYMPNIIENLWVDPNLSKFANA